MHNHFLSQANSPKYRRSNRKMHRNTQFVLQTFFTRSLLSTRKMHDGALARRKYRPTDTRRILKHPSDVVVCCENKLELSFLLTETQTKSDTDVYEPSGEQYETKLQLSLELPANQFGRPHIGLSLPFCLPSFHTKIHDQYSGSRNRTHATKKTIERELQTEPVLEHQPTLRMQR